MMNFKINSDPHFFKGIDHYQLAEDYLNEIYISVHKKNLSFLGIWTGQHRVGKSVGAVQFADLLDPTFSESMEERVCYHSDTFMESMENIRKDHIKGGCTVWDETQIKHGSRDWYKDINKSINAAIQAFGYLNPIIFFVTQDPSFIDSQPRKLFHSFYEVKRHHNKWSYILPFNIKYNRRIGKPYYIYPRYKVKYFGSMGLKAKLMYIRLMRPSGELIKRYDKHSQKFKDQFLADTHALTKTIREIEEDKTKAQSLNDSDVVVHLLENYLNDPIFISDRGNFGAEEVREKYRISFRAAKRIAHRASIKRKELIKNARV